TAAWRAWKSLGCSSWPGRSRGMSTTGCGKTYSTIVSGIRGRWGSCWRNWRSWSGMVRRGRGRHPVFDSSDRLLDASVAAELDLHGFNAAEAPSAVRAFLERWQRRKAGAVVLLITGKGKGSPKGRVLRG